MPTPGLLSEVRVDRQRPAGTIALCQICGSAIVLREARWSVAGRLVLGPLDIRGRTTWVHFRPAAHRGVPLPSVLDGGYVDGTWIPRSQARRRRTPLHPGNQP